MIQDTKMSGTDCTVHSVTHTWAAGSDSMEPTFKPNGISLTKKGFMLLSIPVKHVVISLKAILVLG